MQNGEPVYDIYSHTFILEKFLPDMKPEEKQALSLIAGLYQYCFGQDRKEALVATTPVLNNKFGLLNSMQLKRWVTKQSLRA